MAEVQYAPGTTIFVPSDANGWEAMTVDSCTGFGEAATIRAHQTAASARGGSSVRVLRQEEVSRIQECDVLALEGAPDMVKFAKLSEATLLHNLRVRYARDDIYTRAGSILISVNPFKRLSIYTPERMAQCKDADAKALQDLEPHVYALAEAAFRGILVEQRQQSILISGESGAGKTEAVKACLQYLVARSNEAIATDPARAKYVEECIVQANPLLEAIGNAKTVRNGNSSRFGKWVEVQFDASGFITASRVTSYLLEKSRVTEHGMDERTYHVLYQLCRGCSREQSTKLKLLPAADFHYLGDSAALKVSGVDDVEWWAASCKAMDVFAIDDEGQLALQSVLAAVLHIGNLTFEAMKLAQQDDGSAVSGAAKPRLDDAAELLGLDATAFEEAMTVKSVGKFPVVQVPLIATDDLPCMQVHRRAGTATSLLWNDTTP